MEEMLRTDFEFHPIGQGCFYTGSILFERKPNLHFKFVYDCGTDSKMNYLEDEIKIYKRHLTNDVLDLLMISHFDADHVNGVFTLLNGIHCKRVVIPYYDPIERLLLYVTTTSTDQDYLSFLRNPINFLTDPDRFNVDEIIIMGGPENRIEGNDFNPDDITPDDKISFEEANKKIEEFKELPFNAVLKDFNIGDQFTESIKNRESVDTNFFKAKLLAKPFNLGIGIWEFYFYLKEHQNTALIKKFTSDVNQVLASKGLSIFDLFSENNVIELKDLYKTYFGENLNGTSLVTFHGPLFNTHNSNNQLNRINWSCARGRWFCMDKNFGTLLTGDVELKRKAEVDSLLKYFGSRINDISFFQVPHHGSKGNWYSKHPNGLDSFNNYIINHGLGRKHHPSSDVIFDIKSHCKGSIHLNNEVNKFEYGFEFLF